MSQLPPPPPRPIPTHNGCLTAFLIVLGAILLLPGVCVGLFDIRYGRLAVAGSGVMIAIGLLRLTRVIFNNRADNPRSGIREISIFVAWGVVFFLIILSFKWVSDMNDLGHTRWQ
jgi:hypothetical protein